MPAPLMPLLVAARGPRTERRPPRATSAAARIAAGLLAAACALPAFAQPAGELDLGEPSVLSQRGQRVKLALPFGSAPGERVSALRFEVVSVSAPAGWKAPDASSFTVSKSARRNLVFLQSRDPTDAPELTFAVRVAGQPGEPQAWTVAVPPARASVTPVSYDAAPPVPGRPAGRAARRDPRRPSDTPSR